MSTDNRSDARPRYGDDPCGIILCDKPSGITSHGVVATVRRRLGRGVKVGHAGTLDPFATGLLLVLVGRATRVQRFLMALPKRYLAVARFGAVSSTGDPEGEITETGLVPEGELDLPVGPLRQRPPAYSAVKVGGRRAYALARAGDAREDLPERVIEVYGFRERSRTRDRREFEIDCSSGTYVRTLIAELGDAYCEQLRRIAIGPFTVAQADSGRVIPLEQALAFLPEQRLDEEAARLAAHGGAVRAGDVSPGGGLGDLFRFPKQISQPEVVRLADDRGLIAIAERRGDQLKPIVGLRG